MKAQMPPRRCASAMTWYTSVVLPEASGPKISTTRPRGSPPMPSAMSSASEPVEIAPIETCGRSLIRITEPFPNCRSICPNATSSASSRFISSSYSALPSEHDSSTSYRAPDGCRRESKAAAPDGTNAPMVGSGGSSLGRSRKRSTVTCGSHGLPRARTRRDARDLRCTPSASARALPLGSARTSIPTERVSR